MRMNYTQCPVLLMISRRDMGQASSSRNKKEGIDCEKYFKVKHNNVGG